MRSSGVTKKHVRVPDMSQSCKTGLTYAVGIKEVTVGGGTASGINLSLLILSSLTQTHKKT